MAVKETYESFKKSRWFPLIIGIACIVFGILCVANPEARLQSIALFIGIAILLSGLVQILSGIVSRSDKKILISSLIIGIILVVLAIVIFVNLELMGKYLPTIFGFMMILGVLPNIFRSIAMVSNGVKSGWVSLIVALVVAGLGIYMVVQPGVVGKAFGIFSGIVLIIYGLSNLVNSIMTK